MKKTLIILVIALIALIALTGCSPKNYDAFAQCLSQKNITMYGTSWCPHCQAQKALFGDSFIYVNYVDCDEKKDVCGAEGIEGYPTWKVGEAPYPGEKSFQQLAELSGCPLP